MKSKYSKSLTAEIENFISKYKTKTNGYEICKDRQSLTIDNFCEDEKLFVNILVTMDSLELTPSVEFIKTFHGKFSMSTIFWYKQNSEVIEYIIENLEKLRVLGDNIGSRFQKNIFTDSQLEKIVKALQKKDMQWLGFFSRNQKYPDKLLTKNFSEDVVFSRLGLDNIPDSYLKKHIEKAFSYDRFKSGCNDGFTSEKIVKLITKKDYQKLYIKHQGNIPYCEKYMDKPFFKKIIPLASNDKWKPFNSNYDFSIYWSNPCFDLELFESFKKSFTNFPNVQNYFHFTRNANKSICDAYKKELIDYIKVSSPSDKFEKQLKVINPQIYKLYTLVTNKRELQSFVGNKGEGLLPPSLFAWPEISNTDYERYTKTPMLKKFYRERNILSKKYTSDAVKEIEALTKKIDNFK